MTKRNSTSRFASICIATVLLATLCPGPLPAADVMDAYEWKPVCLGAGGWESEWQTRYGMDTHALGGFAPEDYRQPAFGAEYPYKPTASFAGIGKGEDVKGLSWRAECDYLGSPLGAWRAPCIGHIESIAK